MNNESMDDKCQSCGSGRCATGNCRQCNCSHHKAVPVFIILIAATFLLGQWNILSENSVAMIWPILLGAIGVTKLMKRKCTCC